MTKSEAIEILRCRKDGDAAEALEVVLKAAEEQTCEDAVSRTEVLSYLARTYYSGLGKKKSYEYNMRFVSMMPSIQPIPIMYYPQVPGVTPCVVPDGCGDWVKNGEHKNFTTNNKTDYKGEKK